MAAISKVIILSEEDYVTLYTTGSLTKTIDGTPITIQYDVNNLHFTDYITAEMVDDSNSSKKFLTVQQAQELAIIPSKQDELVGDSTNPQKTQNLKTVGGTNLLGQGNIPIQAPLVSGTNIKTVNGNSVLGSGNLVIDCDSVTYETNPNNITTNNTGKLKIAVLQSEPATRYAGWLYIITG